MNDVGKRQVRDCVSFVKRDAAESREALGRLSYWIGRVPRAAWCAVTGRHRWGDWQESSTFFVPPEQRYCSRCGGREYRGEWSSYDIRVGVGSTRPAP